MRVIRAPGVFWGAVDGQTVVCDVRTGELYKLNDVGTFLWEACAETSVESLTARLTAIFPEQDRGQLAIDVNLFVSSLRDKGLLITEEKSLVQTQS